MQEAASPPRLRTSFERCGERHFSGFVVDLDNLARKFVAEILVDGLPVKTLRAEGYVGDLVRDHVGDGCYGFFFTLPTGALGDCSIVEARLANLDVSIGTSIEIARSSGAPMRSGGPGSVRWLGGLRFSGWLASDEEAPVVKIFIEGKLIAKIYARGWTHMGMSGDDVPSSARI